MPEDSKAPTRPPGRPRQQGQESGREGLLRVARQEFGRKGYAATSVEELVTIAEVKSPTLYHHFGSKRGLFVAAARDAYDRTLMNFRAAIKRDASFHETLHSLIDASSVMMRDEPSLQMMICTMQFELRRDPDLGKDLRPALREFREFFDEVVERAPHHLRPTPQAARDLCHLLIAVVAGIATESLLFVRSEDGDNMLEALRRCIGPLE